MHKRWMERKMPEKKREERERERDIEREESNRCLVGSWCCSWISYKSERIQAMRIIYDRPDRTPSRNPLWTVSLLFLLRCTINTIAVKNRDSRKIQTVSRAHDSLYRYGYNILSISEENSYSPPLRSPRLHKLSEQDIFCMEFSS